MAILIILPASLYQLTQMEFYISQRTLGLILCSKLLLHLRIPQVLIQLSQTTLKLFKMAVKM